MLERPAIIDIMPWGIHVVGASGVLIVIFWQRVNGRFRLDLGYEIRGQ